ncbi:MAG: hypothetical protein ACR2QU_13190 [Gammaproteobacteria bacterium]
MSDARSIQAGRRPSCSPGTGYLLAGLSSVLVLVMSVAGAVDVVEASPAAAGLSAGTPGARPGLSRSRPAIDARSMSQDRRGLSGHRSTYSSPHNRRLRYRHYGYDRYRYGYSDRSRSSGGTRINIFAPGRSATYRGGPVPVPRRMPGSGVCRDSASQLCVVPGANFHSVELICDTDSQRFMTDAIRSALRLSCQKGHISSVWIERPGRSPGQGEGLGIRFDPAECPLPSPCEAQSEIPEPTYDGNSTH